MELEYLLDPGDIALRVALAAVLGGLIGFEREYNEQPAGFRTHILVSLGAALFTLVGAGLVFSGEGRVAQVDPTRVAAQVVTGIGFLGAGAILRQGVTIRGLTTAASLWVTAAVGTAVGLGYWWGAVMVTGVTVLALLGLKPLEHAVFGKLRRGRYRLVLQIDERVHLSAIARIIEEAGGHADDVRLHTDEAGNGTVVTAIKLPPGVDVNAVAASMSREDGVLEVRVS